MTNKLFFGFLLFFCFAYFQTAAQVKKNDNDSVKVYKKIETYSKKNKVNSFIYRLLFKSNRKSAASANTKRKRYFIKKAFDRNEGKIIRSINIETLDPFGYAVDNYKDVPEKSVEKFGNSLHVKTKNWTIRNLLLFKKNEPLDSLLAKESERLIRRQRYVRSVIINPVEIPNCKDSVDISIRVLDSWSLIPTGAISNSQGNFELTERNFMGLGHEFQNDITRRFDTGQNAYKAKYSISNIKNTFINATLTYENSLNNYTTKSARLERQFFSPFTRLAGGIILENRFYIDSLPDTNSVFANQRFKLETQEYWFGHSFKIFGGRNEDYRTTNLVTSVGCKNVTYIEEPNFAYDPSKFFSSEKIYLATIGLNTRKFAEDKYLFNFGIIEDVPYGQVYSITGGIQDKNNLKRSYFGGRFAYGNYFDFGYLSTNIEWGSFYNNGCTEETTFRIEANYFTNLLSVGDWKIRQFIKPTIVFGNHRAPIIKDRLSISDQNLISGFSNPLINGTKKLTVAFQTQTYVPGNWHGFHFSPFYNMTFGVLGDVNNKVFSDKLYSKFSIGVLINNDYLVFNSFQISFSFYPSIPYEGTNLFKTNSFKNDDLALPDFQIGQPVIVPFK
ncbi:hypothetical protein [Flavobacterium sp. XGLA_31]|uniref:hypothetical protein n=1 Tax=Flavobacterium sp. XGLA_31 TaxID=3447666 RepID=UPI003F4152DD